MEIIKKYLPQKKDALYPFQKRNIADIKKIVVHHTGDGNKVTGTHDDLVNRYNIYHQVNHSWTGISYMFTIHESGSVYQHFDFDTVAWHDGINYDSIGIAVIGDFRKALGFNVITQNAKQSLQTLLDILTQEHPEFPASQPDVYGHSERMATSCPGDLLPLVISYRNTGKLDKTVSTLNEIPIPQASIFDTLKEGTFDIINENDAPLIDISTGAIVKQFPAKTSLIANFENNEYYMTKYSFDKRLTNVLRKSEWKLRNITNEPEPILTDNIILDENKKLKEELQNAKEQYDRLLSNLQNTEKEKAEANEKDRLLQEQLNELKQENSILSQGLKDCDKYIIENEKLLDQIDELNKTIKSNKDILDNLNNKDTVDTVIKSSVNNFSIFLMNLLQRITSRKFLLALFGMLVTYQTGNETLTAIIGGVYALLNVLEKNSINNENKENN